MKLVEKKFKWCEDPYGFFWLHKHTALCEDSIKTLFPFIPENVETIWISLHDRPSQNRHKVVILKSILTTTPKTCTLIIPGYNFLVDGDLTDKLLYPFIGKKVYLQVEYKG